MATYELPKSDFTPHPAGTYEGKIVTVEDKGEVETQFGRKPKLAITIESHTARMDDGQPYTAWLWVTLSGSPKSNLHKLRSTLAGRDLTSEERAHFKDTELVNRRVGYQIVHREGKEGGIFANVDNVWPLRDAPPQSGMDTGTGDLSFS